MAKFDDNDLEQHILLGEDNEHFMVQHPDGSKFMVAKKGLSKKHLDNMKQHFAKGGMVKSDYVSVKHPDGREYKVHRKLLPMRMAEGGDVPDGGTEDVPKIPTVNEMKAAAGVPVDAGVVEVPQSDGTKVRVKRTPEVRALLDKVSQDPGNLEEAPEVAVAKDPFGPPSGPTATASVQPGAVADVHSLSSKVADEEGVPPEILHAVMMQESGGNPNATAPGYNPNPKKGETKNTHAGLMQLGDAERSRFGVTDPFDPESNLRGGAKYLKYLGDKYKGDWRKALTAYNAGEGNVDKYGANLPDEVPHDPDYAYKVWSRLNEPIAGPQTADTSATADADSASGVPSQYANLPGNRLPGQNARSAYEIANGLPAGGAELPGLTEMIPQAVKDWWNSGKVAGEDESANQSVDPSQAGPNQSVQPPPGTVLPNGQVVSPITGAPINAGGASANASSSSQAGAGGVGGPGSVQSGSGQISQPQFGMPTPPDTSGQEAAVNAQALAAQGLATAQAKVQDDLARGQQQAYSDLQDRLQGPVNPATGKRTGGEQAVGEQLFQQLAKGRVDPERYWMPKTDDPDTSGMGHSRVLAAIGAALGGFSQGLVGGSNPALDYINQAINRDVDAQKANLDRKSTIYSQFLNKTQNANQAYLLTQAAMKDVAAGQLAKAASENASPIIQANAQKSIADIRQQAAQARYQAALQAPDFQLKLLQLQQVHGQMEALNGLRSSLSGGTGVQVLDPRLPQSMRELMVNAINPNGSRIGYVPAPSKEVAEKYRTEVEPVQTFRNNLRRLRALVAENPRGGVPTSDEAIELQSLRNALTVMVPGAIEGVNRLTEQEYHAAKSLFDEVGNWSNFVSGQGLSQLDAIDSMLGQNIASKNRTYLGLGR